MTQSVILFFGDLGAIGGNGDNGRRDSHRLYEKNHGEAGAVEGGWDVVYYRVRGIAGICGN